MVARIGIFIFFLLGLCEIGVAGALRVSDLLDLPPVMESLFGNPVVETRPESALWGTAKIAGVAGYDPMKGFETRRTRPRVLLSGAPGSDSFKLRERVAAALLECFYDEVLSEKSRSWHARRMKMVELVPVDRELFLDWGATRLLTGKSPEPWFEAWWRLRMGMPLTLDREHQLLIMNLVFDHDKIKISLGHFCFGVRKIGGDPERDLAFDFRAPWELDRKPRLTEAMNLNNRLTLKGFSANLYDWLYTQSEYRNCYVEIWFLPIYEEERALLFSFAEKGGLHRGGQFRAFRKNCTSLGLAFLDRLRPLSQPSPLGRGLADVPVAEIRRILKDYDDAPFYRFESKTTTRGREPSAKSEIRRPAEGRMASRPFQMLRETERAGFPPEIEASR